VAPVASTGAAGSEPHAATSMATAMADAARERRGSMGGSSGEWTIRPAQFPERFRSCLEAVPYA
jgi:hypothetical protein